MPTPNTEMLSVQLTDLHESLKRVEEKADEGFTKMNNRLLKVEKFMYTAIGAIGLLMIMDIPTRILAYLWP